MFVCSVIESAPCGESVGDTLCQLRYWRARFLEFGSVQLAALWAKSKKSFICSPWADMPFLKYYRPALPLPVIGGLDMHQAS